MGKTQTAVYFASNKITITQGQVNKKTRQVNITKKIQVEMPEGAVLNGVITDEERLLEAFSKAVGIFGSFTNTVLVIDSSHIIFRLSVLPKVSDKEMRELVKNEFANRDMSDKEYVYDYAFLKARHLNNKQRFVMSCAVDKTIIDAYKAFFQRAGVKLKAVDFSSNVLMQVLSEVTSLYDNENTLICVVNHYIVTLINLLSNGEIYFHRARILSTEPGNAYFSEISDIIYSNQRGRVSANRNEKTENIYIFDTNTYAPDEYDTRAQQLEFKNIHIGLKNIIDVPSLSEDAIDGYIYNLCSMRTSTQKSLNFLDYHVKKSINKRMLGWSIAGILALGVIGAGGGYILLTQAKILLMEIELNDINNWLSSEEVRTADDNYNELTSIYSVVSSALVAYEDYDALVSDTAIMEKDIVLNAIASFESKAVIDHIYFDVETRSVTFDCYTVNPEDISYYVGKLRATGLFADIVYAGYDEVNRYSDIDYFYEVMGILKEVKSNE